MYRNNGLLYNVPVVPHTLTNSTALSFVLVCMTYVHVHVY